jgi:hypothetical protein
MNREGAKSAKKKMEKKENQPNPMAAKPDGSLNLLRVLRPFAVTRIEQCNPQPSTRNL